ncbi:hypothetical protein DCCM_2736 [Desulfocucumis palustris]|uniref:Wadjet protein JetD C-terminal domain-containing protein n=1 Tax=Desulfocucumis palustris TaxID=1898651 RepID=A0A2L2XBX3_9FIRM|nr:TIGR02679 family protein [Desulfocucumis palustris]GBF33630.1 hypothetical protein DCCM_2736 [Desulfocucumis palustris]
MDAMVIARRMRAAGIGFLLDQAQALLERSGRSLEELRGNPAALRGVIHLNLSVAERKALADFWGHRRLAGKNGAKHTRIRLLDLHERLREYGADLFSVLEVDVGSFHTRADRETVLVEALTREHQRLRMAFAGSATVLSWLEGLLKDTPSGKWFRRAWNGDREAAVTAAKNVALAISVLPATGESHLAMFAARVTGDPHCFDQGTPAGQLLLTAIGELFGCAPGRSHLPLSVWRGLQLGQASLEVDGISSDVAVANFRDSGHPVIQSMADQGGGWKIPLREVRGLQRLQAHQRSAYVLENPSVFQTFADRTRHWPFDERPLLVCTAGFLSAAGYQLMERLAGVGYRLYYGGDFDSNGISIALALKQRFPELILWRMSVEDYRTALALRTVAVNLSVKDVARLGLVEGELAEVAWAMLSTKKPAYQEQVAGQLWADLEKQRRLSL